MNILIVDDHLTNLKLLRAQLEAEGHAVFEAHDGVEALSLLERQRVDAVISDILMPRMDGYRLCHEIRTHARLRDLPIIIYSSTYTAPEDEKLALDMGANKYLKKPASVETIAAALHEVIAQPHAAPRPDARREVEVLKNYNERLVSKLKEKNVELMAAEAKFRPLVEQSLVGIYVIQDDQFVYVNPRMAEILGRSAEEMTSRTVYDFLVPEGHAFARENIRKRMSGAVPNVHYDLRVLHQSGAVLKVEVYGSRTEYNGRPAVMGVLLDITERKRAEDTLRKSDADLNDAQRVAQVGSWTWNATTDTITWSEEYYRIYGRDLKQRPPGYKEHLQLYTPESAARLDAVVKKALQTGQPYELELEQARTDGKRRWVTARGEITRDESGRIDGLRGTAHDITERKVAEEAEARLVAILEATPDFIATGDLDGNVLFVNKAGLGMLGYHASEGMPALRIGKSQPGWAAKLVVEQGIPHAVEHGSWSGETAFLRRDGREIPVSQVIIAHRGGDGSVEYLSTIARDISVHKAHEKRIMRLNRMYAVLSGINATIVHTRDRQELFEEACRIAVEQGTFALTWIGLLDASGLDVTPVARAGVDEGYLDNIHLTARDDAPDRCELVARALREKTAVVCNDIDTDPQMARWRDEALRRGYRSVVVFPLQSAGKVLGILLFYASEKDFFDTEEMRLLAEIAGNISFALDHLKADESRHVQSAALNAAADAIVITDRAGIIEWVNPAFTQLTGYTAEEALGKNPRNLVKSDKHAPAFYKDFWDTILAGRTWHGEMINRRKDGSLFTEDESVTPILDASGAITHFVAIKEDMTDRLQLEAEFRQAQKMESVGQLASGIAHDFNNLLTVINGMSQLVLAGGSTVDPVYADVQEILRAGERAATLTRQLLAFSRQQILEPRVLNFDTAVVRMESLLRRLLGEDIDLVVVPTPGLGNVKADPGQIEQVITNLAVNARDAMPQGGQLTIETQNVTIDKDYARQIGVTMPPGSYVLLAVSDSGGGMDEATRARIFEPFFTTKGPSRGTGLGLSTVYGIVKQSHGFIGVYSEVGQGTSFKIYLPQVTEAAGTDRPGPTVVSSSGTETILLVEDNAGLRKLATRFLEPAGYTVLGAGTGEEALLVLARHAAPVHLLLTDVVMPGMSGRDLVELLARTHPGMKVLYMSGYTSDTVVRHGVLEEKVSFINKPFNAAALLHKVREVLDSTDEGNSG